MIASTGPAEREGLAKIASLVGEEAATLVMGGFRSRPHVDYKGQHDLVTEFDRASEQLIIQRLSSLSPGIPIVGEEQTSSERDAEGRPGLVWYVDPLDGTTNFVHGHPFWAIAIGLMENDRPVLGAVIASAIGLRWLGWVAQPGSTAGAGHGYRNKQRCSVSAVPTLGEAMIATGFPASRSAAPANNFASFTSVKQAAQAVRRCGSAAIDLCMVADGTYEGYWERSLHAWDTVAASAIVLAAGGTITAIDGAPPNYHVGYLAASNGLVHAELLAALDSSQATGSR